MNGNVRFIKCLLLLKYLSKFLFVLFQIIQLAAVTVLADISNAYTNLIENGKYIRRRQEGNGKIMSVNNFIIATTIIISIPFCQDQL